MPQGEAYRHLASVCAQRSLKLRLCASKDAPPKLTALEVPHTDGVTRVMLENHTLDTAAEVVLRALAAKGAL